jgi:DNA/RNA-binding domain of Phe-tRNA-synthetase-like protein
VTLREAPFAVVHELPGWTLLWALLELAEPAGAPAAAARDGVPFADPGTRDGAAGDGGGLAGLRQRAAAEARARHGLGELPADATIAAVRQLFRAAGCDPTRYRPSSEALLRRLLKGEELPVIHPLVDLCNCLSIGLAVPCGLAAEGSFEPPVRLRAGADGEQFDSLRGPFPLAGKPLLADARGPLGTPITDGQRGKVLPGTRRAWLIVYLPAAAPAPAPEAALESLTALLAAAPVARLEHAAVSRRES